MIFTVFFAKEIDGNVLAVVGRKSVCKQVADAEGDILFGAEADEGSCFWVEGAVASIAAEAGGGAVEIVETCAALGEGVTSGVGLDEVASGVTGALTGVVDAEVGIPVWGDRSAAECSLRRQRGHAE